MILLFSVYNDHCHSIRHMVTQTAKWQAQKISTEVLTQRGQSYRSLECQQYTDNIAFTILADDYSEGKQLIHQNHHKA